ncbi:hypothetical protein ACHAXS_000193 [Conticribra weissflogii]
MQFAQGKRYGGGFVESPNSWAAWIAKKVDRWAYVVQILAAIEKYFLQMAHAGLASSLQVPCALAPVEAATQEEFLLALFARILSVEITDNIWTLFGHSVKHGDLGLQIPIAVPDGPHGVLGEGERAGPLVT